jgi:hypothetical protein
VRAVLACDVRGAVGRAVVDDEDVRLGKRRPELVEDGRKRLLLVQRGDEDDRVQL